MLNQANSIDFPNYQQISVFSFDVAIATVVEFEVTFASVHWTSTSIDSGEDCFVESASLTDLHCHLRTYVEWCYRHTLKIVNFEVNGRTFRTSLLKWCNTYYLDCIVRASLSNCHTDVKTLLPHHKWLISCLFHRTPAIDHRFVSQPKEREKMLIVRQIQALLTGAVGCIDFEKYFFEGWTGYIRLIILTEFYCR